MKKSKFLSLLLALVIVVTSTANSVAGVFAASAEPTITVSSVESGSGENITITVSLSNNPGICTARLAINYNSQLTLTSADDAGLLNDYVFGRDYSANPYYVYWDDSLANNNNYKNGVIVRLKFKISEHATSGLHKVWITYNTDEIYNLELEDIEFKTVAGGVTVAGGSHQHSFTNYVSDGNATCTVDGTKTAKCDFCDETDTMTDEGSIIPHSFTNYVINKDASCTENGTKTAYCDYGCGATETKAIPATGHNYDTVVVAPTCTEQGYTTHICNACSDSYTDSYIDATGHNYVNGVCTRCGEKESIDSFSYTLGSDGGIHITGYYGDDTVLNIAESYVINGEVRYVTAIEEYAFEQNENITSVTLPYTIKSVGDFAFYDCTSLTEVILFSKYADIGERAFGYYYISRREDGKVSGFSLTAYEGGTAHDYILENEFAFIKQTKPVGKGDIDGNGEFDSADLVAMKKQLLSIITLNGEYLEAANINGDNVIDIRDLIGLKKKIS